MGNSSKVLHQLPPEQEAIRAKCFHPSGTFVEFTKEEIEQSIPERFEKIVRMYPHRIAVKSKNHALTYDDLDKAANLVAKEILVATGNTNAPVALLLENDAPMIIGILATLKAGQTYVPLDPSYPLARLAFMLGDSQAKLIVSNTLNFALANTLTNSEHYKINLDELSSKSIDAPLGLFIAPERFAVIVYTSGSTGEPKGVVQSHRNLLHKVMNQTNAFHISADDRLSLLYSCSFAGSLRSIFCALLNGASLFPYDVKSLGSPHLVPWLQSEKITIYLSVPTIFRHFIDEMSENDRFCSVRIVYLGSEAVTKKDVERYKKHFPKNCVLVNSMATSESGTILQYFIDREKVIRDDVVPVGYAEPGKEVFILDEEGKKLGVGEIGEIAVQSKYLSPGYWRKPSLTQNKFFPVTKAAGMRLYLTGDLGCIHPDGCFEHHGRKDSRTKIGGLWIDTAAIENSLMALENIREASVVAIENNRGQKTLVAYIVPTKVGSLSVEMLRRGLAPELPNDAVPSRFVFLDALPLTPNGKVNRRELPDPDLSRPELEAPYVAPRTDLEAKLAMVWAQLLSLDQVGIHDNFFDLGGHSLAATQLICQVIQKFHLELPIKALFDAPTVAQMALIIKQNQAKLATDAEVARMLCEVEAITEEEAQKMLAGEDAESQKVDGNE